jgi:hypothetical protein
MEIPRSIKQVDMILNRCLISMKKKENHLEYYINNIENEDIFDIFKKSENVSLCLQLFHSNTNAKKKKKKKKKKKMKVIQSTTSFSGSFFASQLCICAHFAGFNLNLMCVLFLR